MESLMFKWGKDIWNTVPSEGILFVRLHKIGSSTGCGITLQVAHAVAKQKCIHEHDAASPTTDTP